MRKTVLVVENDFLIALDLALMLEKDGWNVLGPAATVAEALRLLDLERPAVALLDFSLQDGNVTPVAEALRARNVPFVVASAFSPPQRLGAEVFAGALNIGKPISERRLLAVLEKFVEA